VGGHPPNAGGLDPPDGRGQASSRGRRAPPSRRPWAGILQRPGDSAPDSRGRASSSGQLLGWAPEASLSHRAGLVPDATTAPLRAPSCERVRRRIPTTPSRNQVAGTGSGHTQNITCRGVLPIARRKIFPQLAVMPLVATGHSWSPGPPSRSPRPQCRMISPWRRRASGASREVTPPDARERRRKGRCRREGTRCTWGFGRGRPFVRAG